MDFCVSSRAGGGPRVSLTPHGASIAKMGGVSETHWQLFHGTDADTARRTLKNALSARRPARHNN